MKTLGGCLVSDLCTHYDANREGFMMITHPVVIIVYVIFPTPQFTWKFFRCSLRRRNGRWTRTLIAMLFDKQVDSFTPSTG